MNLLTSYSRARKLKNTTSRHQNANWYKEARHHSEQLHYIVANDIDVLLFHYDLESNVWTKLSEFPKKELSADSFDQHITQVLEHITISPDTGVGIIIHQSHDFLLREGRHKYDECSIDEINKLLLSTPEDVLDDPKAREAQLLMRAIPLSRSSKEQSTYLVGNLRPEMDPFLRKWRDYGQANNLPITSELFASPPLLCSFISELSREKASPKSASVILIVGKQLSHLSYFNAAGEPLFYRILHHFGGNLPNQLAQTVDNTAAQLGLENYELFYTFASQDRSAKDSLEMKLSLALGDLKLVDIDWNAPFFQRIELAMISHFEQGHTPEHLFQSYINIEESEALAYPTETEMKILNVTDTIKKVAALVTILFLGYQAFLSTKMIRQEAWKFDPNSLQALDTSVKHYQGLQRKMHLDNSLLKDRSEAWENMELLSRAFPFSQGFLVKHFSYRTAPIYSPNMPNTGLVRTWEIRGNAKEESADRIAQLRNKDEIVKLFSSMERPSFTPGMDSRNLIINLEVTNSTSSGTSSHPIWFKAVITQRLEPNDPLALSIK